MKATITTADGRTKEVPGYIGHTVSEMGNLEVFSDRLPEDVPTLTIQSLEWRAIEVTA